MGTNTDISAFIAANGVTKCAPEASGKVASKPAHKGGMAGKRRKRAPHASASVTVDTTVDGWQFNALAMPEVQDSIKSGVFSALVGSGWLTDAETVEGRISHVKVILAEKYLCSWDTYTGPNKNTLTGYVRMVAYQKTVSYIKLHVHLYDGSARAMRIDSTDATAEDAAPRVIADDASAVAYLRVEQRQRLTAALDALDATERAHFDALMAGDTSAEFAASAGLSPVQATRQKTAMMAKLAALVQE